MALHVKDAKTDALVRELARTRGIGITEAIREAVEEALAAHRAQSEGSTAALKRRLGPLLQEMKSYKSYGQPIDKGFYDRLWADEGLGEEPTENSR